MSLLPLAGAKGCSCSHRLAPHVTSMQPLSTLQQLTAVTFTECDHSAGKQLPTAALAALTGLVALDAFGCTAFKAAGVERMRR
jgi:hypothetical protein